LPYGKNEVGKPLLTATALTATVLIATDDNPNVVVHLVVDSAKVVRADDALNTKTKLVIQIALCKVRQTNLSENRQDHYSQNAPNTEQRKLVNINCHEVHLPFEFRFTPLAVTGL